MLRVNRLVEINSVIQKDIQAHGCAQYTVPWVSPLDAYLDVLGFYCVGYIDRHFNGVKSRAFCKIMFRPIHCIHFPEPIGINIFTDDKHYAVLKLTADRQLRMMSCYGIDCLISVIEKKEIVGSTIFDNPDHNAQILVRLRREREIIEMFTAPIVV